MSDDGSSLEAAFAKRNAERRLMNAAPALLDALVETAICLEAVATGRSGGNWQRVIADARAVVKVATQPSDT